MECTSKGPIRHSGDIIITGPGNIATCRYILHTVIPHYNGPNGKAVKVYFNFKTILP